MLNNDTIPTLKTFLELKKEFLRHPNCSVAGSIIVNKDGSTQVSYGKLNKYTGLIKTYKNTMYNGLFYPIGASLFTSNEILLKLGDFEEKYFLYHEELDFVLKGKKLGLVPLVCENSKLFHIQGASTKTKSGGTKNLALEKYKLAGIKLLYKSHFPRLFYAVYISYFMKIIQALKRKDYQYFKLVLKHIIKS